ncbi:MAG: zinc-dependent metalloprotease [Candidatus Eisenbacteria bacterium]
MKKNTLARIGTGVAVATALSLTLGDLARGYVRIDVDTNRDTAWIGPDVPVPWSLNTSIDDNSISNEFEILRESFNVWQNHVANLDVQFQEGASTTFCGLSQNGVNHLSMEDCFSQCTGSCLAVTSTILYAVGDGFWNTNTVSDSLLLARQESDITWSATRNWDDYRDWPPCSNAFDLWGVTIHEMGHFIGLGHSALGSATMFASIAPCDSTKASLSTDDKRGARTLYRTGTRVAATTMEAGQALLTVTNKGNVGFTGSGGKIGESFRWAPLGAAEHVYEASFALGTVNGPVSDNYRVESAGLPGGDADFQQASPLVIDGTPEYTDQEATAVFDDSRAENPYGVDVTANYFADNDAPNDDFVICEYVITNNSGSAINNLRGAIFADVDFNAQYSLNSVSYDAANDLAYVTTPNTGAAFGIAVLNVEGAVAMRALANLTDDPTDANKTAWLSGGFGTTSAGPADIALMIATGDFDLANGETGYAAFAFLGGSSLADLQANAQAAQTLYQTVIHGDPSAVDDPLEGHPAIPLALEQNSPNPFQDSTRLEYQLNAEGPVQLDVVDASGRLVRNLIDEVQTKGHYTVTFDGLDQAGRQLPAGVYFTRLRTHAGGETRKMHLIR